MSSESKELNIEVPEDCLKKWMKLKKDRRHKHVIYTINEEKNCLEVEKTGGRGATFETLKKHLNRKNCRYVVWNQEKKMPDGRLNETIYFISWAPRTATTRQNVMYSTQKKTVLQNFDGCKEVEARTFEELAKEVGMVEESDEEEWDPDA